MKHKTEIALLKEDIHRLVICRDGLHLSPERAKELCSEVDELSKNHDNLVLENSKLRERVGFLEAMEKFGI